MWGRKGPESFADLTVLPGITNVQTVSPMQVANAIVGWRNVGSGATVHLYRRAVRIFVHPRATSDNFFSNILGQSTRFVTAITDFSAASGNTGVADRMFTSRQQLISLMQDAAGGNAADEAYLQDAMMYLGTFTRTLNQPSYYPDTTRPIVLAGNSTVPTYGNNGQGLDKSSAIFIIPRSRRLV